MFARAFRLSVVAALSVLVLVALAEAPTVGIGGRPKPITIPCAVVISPDATTGGSTVQATVTLDGTTEEDQVVAMETDHPEVYANFPANVVVSAGNDSVTFDLTTVQVSGSVATTVYASCNDGQASGTLTVNP
jgi:hypothetical protein